MESNLSKIEQIHDDVFACLLEKHFEEKKQGNDFFFKTRQRFSSGKERFWFLGGETYVAVSFWTGTDYQNKTSNVYLDINVEGRIALFVVGKADEEKYRFLSVLANPLSGFNIPGLQPLDNGVWIKTYTEQHQGDYIKFLRQFLEHDKILIDQYLSSQQELSNMLGGEKSNTYADSSIEQSDEDIELSETYPRPIVKEEFYKMLGGVMNRKYTTPDYFFNEVNRPHRSSFVCIKSFEVRNYRGIDRLAIDGIPVDTKWIVLTGENGFGKSSVLQSIAIGLFGNTDSSYQLLDKGGFVMMEAKKGNERFLNLSFNFGTKNFFNSIRDNIAVYGATRLNIGNDSNRPDTVSVMYNLFFPNGSLVNIENELKESKAYNPAKFELLKNAFCKLIPDLQDIEIEAVNGKPVVKYLEQEANEKVTFEQLASGFRNIIAVVGDIITKLSKGMSIGNLQSLSGVVIIDEIELHLHPKYQKSLPTALSSLFPNVLFIVSTHSPIPLLGMPKETVLLRVNRSQGKGITAERLDIDFTNLLPNAILTSPVFGFQDIIPAGHDNENVLEVSDSYEEIIKNEEIESEISSFLSPDKTRELMKFIKKDEE
ncbi:MAG: AAA family ATPase [Bacteroidota bacterium]